VPLLTYPVPTPQKSFLGPASTCDVLPSPQIHDVATQQELASGPLPLTPGSNLAWLGFSEEGLLASYDSGGELRMRSPDFGGAWVPLFSSAAGGRVVGFSSPGGLQLTTVMFLSAAGSFAGLFG